MSRRCSARARSPVSVGARPLTAAQVRESEALFARMRDDAAAARPRLRMHSGRLIEKRAPATLAARLYPGLNAMAYLVPLGLVMLAGGMSLLPVDPVTRTVLQWLVPGLVALMVGHWIHAMVIRPALNATRVAARIAGGDLSIRSEGGAQGILGALLRTLDQLAFNLAGTVGDVRRMADEVSEVSENIASSGSDIADRTVSQAASLEETSAAMEQMTRTISDNAEGARLVDELAHQVQSTAEMGSAAVSDVVATMNKIHESSTRIEDILKVINALSFQTNILSLNAAVEAARAGDMGRGFSVVASEVRNLAQQSSKSAQEIRALIQAASLAVGDGITNVQTARDRIGELVGSVGEVTTAVARISRASEEQADGARQIREAVASLDTATQDTAARADESMSSTLVLQQHSSRLLKAVGLFN
ncbi:MAG: methyl-accepting chemotaxis protein [Burkholderiaceae bacterium]